MALFSVRNKYKSPKDIIQIESMDDDLRIGLWNAVYTSLKRSSAHLYFDPDYHEFIVDIWINFFKKPIDTLGAKCIDSYTFIRNYFMTCKWMEVYDFLEFLYDGCYENKKDFLNRCNKILERELSAYRFVSGKITKITSEIEISEIDEAISSPFDSINSHIHKALVFLSDKKDPDYRNSIKESISAVESMCRLITKKDKATLGDALKLLEEKGFDLHPALKKSFNNLYGYTSNEGGIRHSLLEKGKKLYFEEAKLMLVTCSSFINYLKIKLEKFS